MFSIAWSPDAKCIATGNWAGVISIWQAQDFRKLLELHGHSVGHFIAVLAWSPDGSRLASGGFDNVVKIWNPATGKEVKTLAGHAASITEIAWSPDGKRLATSSQDGTVRIWDPITGVEVMMLCQQKSEQLVGVCDGLFRRHGSIRKPEH